jgi:septum formation protein
MWAVIESKAMFLLASNSPRRRQMFAWTGWPFEVYPVDIDESPLPGEKPPAHVSRLACQKAQAAGSLVGQWQFILAADTIVAIGNDILGKPADSQDAVAMLRKLRGRVHQVFTAVSILERQTGVQKWDLCISQVPMRMYNDGELEDYVASGDPLDKAGAYAIQNAGFHPVENFSDCYASVAGLPLCHVLRLVKGFGINSVKNIPGVCQDNLPYKCPVYQGILEQVCVE